MNSSERNIKIISIALVILAFIMINMPWLKVTGIDAATHDKISSGIDAALAFSNELTDSYDSAEAGFYIDLMKSMKDVALSPTEIFSLSNDLGALANEDVDETPEVKKILNFMMIYKLIFLLTIAAGIYAIVYAIRRKPLLKGFDGFIFPGAMCLLGIAVIVMMFYLNDKAGILNQNIENIFSQYDVEMGKVGFRFSLWLILAIILALPYNVWESVLLRSNAGKKALEKVNMAAEKAGQAIDKGNEKIQGYSASWICPNCGARVSGDALFCSKCGTKRPEEAAKPQPVKQEPKVERPSVCPECGAPISRSDHFCQHCGYSIDEYMKEQEEKAKAEADAAQPEVTPAPAPAEEPEPAPELQEVDLTQEEADNGTIKSVEIPGGKKVRVKLPGGLRDGKKIRLKGMVPKEDGSKEDLILRVRVK